MGDLAQAIVDLGKAGQARKQATRELRQSASVVAAAIRKQLRSGEDLASIVRSWTGKAAETPVLRAFNSETDAGAIHYTVMRFAVDGERPQSALCRHEAVLEDISGNAGSVLQCLDDPDYDGRPFRRASLDELLEFAQEAALVASVFEQQLRSDATAYSNAAQEITKLTVR